MTHDAHPACRRNCWLTAALSGVAVAAFTHLARQAELPAAVLLGALVAVGLGGFLRWAFCAGRIAYVTPPELAPVAPFAPFKLEFPEPTAAPQPAPVAEAAPQPAPVAPSAPIEIPAQIVLAEAPAAALAVEEDPRPIRSPFAPLEDEPAEEPKAPRRRAAKPKAPAEKPTEKPKKAPRATKAQAAADGAGVLTTVPAQGLAPSRARAAKPKSTDRRVEPKPAAPLPPRASGLDFAVNKSKQALPAVSAPEMLASPRDGRADDLKEIRGIGPVIETMLNQLGFWHFDQIASWKARDIAYVDERLVGFHGRISRDEWVRQAQVLAAGGTTDPARRLRRKGGSE